jgi:hypothetical protein
VSGPHFYALYFWEKKLLNAHEKPQLDRGGGRESILFVKSKQIWCLALRNWTNALSSESEQEKWKKMTSHCLVIVISNQQSFSCFTAMSNFTYFYYFQKD